jgi:2'-5' RNA ligase
VAVRAFAAAWPPPEVRAVLAGLPRPPSPGLRWVPPEQWHVTVAFLGDLAEADVEGATAALTDAAHRAAGPPEVALGPATAVLGRSVLVVPATGLEAAAADLRAALGGRSLWFDPTPFTGHLTLARCRGPVPPALAGVAVTAGWPVGALSLVGSFREDGVLRYETLATATVP